MPYMMKALPLSENITCLSPMRTRLASAASCVMTMPVALVTSSALMASGRKATGRIRLKMAMVEDASTRPKRARNPRGASSENSNCHHNVWL
ncbi:hypothetical protein D3C78_1184170 [compost metagenome]